MNDTTDLKFNGIIRRLDTLNRVVIPPSIRKDYGFEGQVTLYTMDDKYVIVEPRKEFSLKRNVDAMGRVTIPKDMCEFLGLKYQDKIDILLGDGFVALCLSEHTKSVKVRNGELIDKVIELSVKCNDISPQDYAKLKATLNKVREGL